MRRTWSSVSDVEMRHSIEVAVNPDFKKDRKHGGPMAKDQAYRAMFHEPTVSTAELIAELQRIATEKCAMSWNSRNSLNVDRLSWFQLSTIFL